MSVLTRHRRAGVIAVAALAVAALPAAGWQSPSANGPAAATTTPGAPAAEASGGAGAGSATPSTNAPGAARQDDAGRDDDDRTAATSSPGSPSTYQPPAVGSVAPSAVPTITPSGRFAVRASGEGTENGATWPDANALFTVAELRQVVPGTRAVRAADCSRSSLPGGGTSAHATRCTLELDRPGAGVPSRVMVVIRSFGTPSAVGTGWTSTVAQAKERSAQRPGLYTFWRNGSLNASSAFTDGTTTRALLQRNGVAAEVWFSGIGFADLKGDYLQSRQTYRNQVAPALVNLLAAKMPG